MENEANYHEIHDESLAPSHPAPKKAKPKKPTKGKQTPAMAAAAKRNLKPAKKGEVLNPYGRWGKAGKPNNLKAILNAIVFEDGEISSKAERIMQVLTSLAEQGNIKAIEIILDRIDGKVAEKVQVESKEALACLVLPNKRGRDEEST